MQMSHSVSSHLTRLLDMKLVVSLLLLWVSTANPRPDVIKENYNPELSSPIKEKFTRPSPFHVPQTVDIGTRANCVQSYSPCRCDAYPNIYVICSDVTVETVRGVFKRVKDSEIHTLYIGIYRADDTGIVSLPADLLGGTNVTGDITIEGSNNANLVIDPFAFRSSQNSLTGEFELQGWDFGLQRDFSFLNGFNKLQTIWILRCDNIFAFQYLPPLPSLRELHLSECTGLITFPDLSSDAKIEYLSASRCSLNDEIADDIVAKLIANSTESLLDLHFPYNYLTRIPNQLGYPFVFPKLKALGLFSNAIKTIENGIFQGTTSSLRDVYLYSNELVVFEEGVFKELLEIMVTASGNLDVGANPFACGCDMAWLIRDNKNLLRYVKGNCGINSLFPNVSFNNLDPESFAHCSIIETTEKATTPTIITPATTTTTTENPSNGFSCENKPDGDYANPFDDCSTTFYKCSNNEQKIEFTCPATTVFNTQIGLCDFPYNVAGCQSR